MKRFTYSNLGIIDKLREEKRDIIAVLGHYNNWEWLTMLPDYLKYKTIIIYKPLQNKYFNSFINNQRSKYGIVLTPTSQIIREIINYRKNNINTVSVFHFRSDPCKRRYQILDNFSESGYCSIYRGRKNCSQNMIWQLYSFIFKKLNVDIIILI